MKKILLVLLICCSTTVLSQELNMPSQFLRDEHPKIYEAVKEYSRNKWKEDHSMILNEINEQSEAYIEILEKAKNTKDPEFPSIFQFSLNKWSEGNQYDNPEDRFTDSTINWKMVLYEINKQLKSKKSY